MWCKKKIWRHFSFPSVSKPSFLDISTFTWGMGVLKLWWIRGLTRVKYVPTFTGKPKVTSGKFSIFLLSYFKWKENLPPVKLRLLALWASLPESNITNTTSHSFRIIFWSSTKESGAHHLSSLFPAWPVNFRHAKKVLKHQRVRYTTSDVSIRRNAVCSVLYCCVCLGVQNSPLGGGAEFPVFSKKCVPSVP